MSILPLHSRSTHHSDITDQPLGEHPAKKIELEHWIVVAFRSMAVREDVKRVVPVARAPVRVPDGVCAVGVHL
jgi:hypothetical protein